MNIPHAGSPRSAIRTALQSLLSALAVVAAVASIPAQVLADDTDVFFPSTVGTTQGVIKPNVLFIVDTSGSMAGTDGYPDSRLQRLKNAFREIMAGINPNVNVGLARFSNTQGGPIMFPVSAVDEFAEDQDLSGVGGDRNVAYRITDTTSEASQKHDNTVSLAPSTLTISDNFVSTNGAFTSASSRTAGEVAEEYSAANNGTTGTGGAVNAGSGRCADEIQLISDNVSRNANCYSQSIVAGGTRTPGTQTVGLRFTGLNLPADAVITSAFISFTAPSLAGSNPSNNGNSSSTVVIRGEKVTNSAAFVGGLNPSPASNRPSSRTQTTAQSSWTIGQNTGYTGNLTTSDLSEVIEEIFDFHQANLVPTVNNLTFLIRTGNSSTLRRTVCEFKYTTNNTSTSVVSNSACSSPDTVPKLTINYFTNSPSNSASKMIGLRFNDVQIPRGVTLTSAKVIFRADNPVMQPDMTISIAAENSDNAAPYTSTNNNISGGGRVYSSTISWNNPPFNTYLDDYQSPELRSIINPILSRSGWCGGNSIALKFEYASISGLFTSRSAVGFSQDPNLAPVLALSFSPSDPALETGCNQTALSSQVSAPTTDDSFQITNNNANFPACDRIYLGSTPSSAPASGCGSSSQTNRTTLAALRFNSVNIPAGATILGATLELTGQTSTESSSANLTITGENVGNPATFASPTNHIGARRSTPGLTGASVVWNSSSSPALGTWIANGKYVSPDLKTIIQELVNRSDWLPNNSIALHIAPTNASDTVGKRTARSVNGSAAAAPKLRILIAGDAGKQTVRQKLVEVVDAFSPVGFTPTMGALYEAALYMRGEEAFYGRTRGAAHDIQSGEIGSDANTMAVNHRAVYDYSAGSPIHNYPPGCSDFNLNSSNCQQESWSGTARYRSPIVDACQSNNIILLSDGEPNNGGRVSGGSPNQSAEQLIAALPGIVNTPSCVGGTLTSSDNNARTRCGKEIAAYLHTKDQVPESRIQGAQTVTTYTIGFGADVSSLNSPGGNFLREVAEAGGGEFYTADSAEDVVTAFNSIISSILDKGSTFVAPAVTINTFNRLTHRNELYFALFEPSSGARWKGNLKRYQLLQRSGDDTPFVYDAQPQKAVDPDTGFFKETSQSFWSSSVDGDKVDQGGAASRLPTSFPVYSFLGSGSPVNFNMIAPANQVIETNAAITDAMLAIPGPSDSGSGATYRQNILKWARGLDVLDEDGDDDTTDARQRMADPLHSEPLLITYVADKTGATAATPVKDQDDDPLIQIYFGTNDGLLRAIDADTGTQPWAFIPKELLPVLHEYYENDQTYKTRSYGMDGPITPYVNDGNRNGFIIQSAVNSTPDTYTVKINGTTPATRNDFAYIYAGQRRGGRAYYALDVTNRNAPVVKFKVEGGLAGTPFSELGETWSEAAPINVRVGGRDYPDDLNRNKAKSTQTKRAILFAGGYDPNQDTKNSNYNSLNAAEPDSQGRGLFLINADTGALLWTASGSSIPPVSSVPHLHLPQMRFSIPASPTAVDITGDGLIDRIYFADTGGQVFRIVLGKEATCTDQIDNDVPADGVVDEADECKSSLSTSGGSNLATGGVFARLGRFTPKTGAPTVDTGLHARRFFSQPGLSLIRPASGNAFIAISIGSGHRETPLSTAIEDRLYVLRDPDISNEGTLLNLSSNPHIGGDADLVDVTDELNSDVIQTAFDVQGKKGFFLRLVGATGELLGEKVLTRATVFSNEVSFATFQPSAEPTSDATSCQAAQGTARFYKVSVFDGTPTFKPSDTLPGDPSATKEDRFVQLSQGGLPPEPALIFTDAGSGTGTGTEEKKDCPLICIGAECISQCLSGRKAFKTYWRKVED